VPGFEDKATVPILFDKKTKTIVNNESIEIMKMLNSEFEMFSEKKINLYPEHLQPLIEENYDWIYNTINNGVYKSGFALTQEAYNDACSSLFLSLDRAEKMLEGKAYLIGNQLTIMDVRLFMTLIRFDPVYIVHFKCNKRSIESYKNLNRYVRHIYHDLGLKKVINMDHITNHYYGSH
jgi:putative glutathione S-transferase